MSLLESIDGVSTWNLLPGKAIMTDSLKNFGYYFMEAATGGLLMEEGERVPVHEFHYGKTTVEGEDFVMKKPAVTRSGRRAFMEKMYMQASPISI